MRLIVACAWRWVSTRGNHRQHARRGHLSRAENDCRAAAQSMAVPWRMGGWRTYALLGAISLAELGTMIPRSGGPYVYSRYALGEYAGVLVGWSDWVSAWGSTAHVSALIGQVSGG